MRRHLRSNQANRSREFAPDHAPQDCLQTGLIKDLIQKAFSGSGKALILAALRGHVSARDQAKMRAIVDLKA